MRWVSVYSVYCNVTTTIFRSRYHAPPYNVERKYKRRSKYSGTPHLFRICKEGMRYNRECHAVTKADPSKEMSG
jgi:hypothetical protein